MYLENLVIENNFKTTILILLLSSRLYTIILVVEIPNCLKIIDFDSFS